MERPTCRGVGFLEDEYTIVIGPEPWPWPFRLSTYTTAFCCLAGCMGNCFIACGKGLVEDLTQCISQLLCCSPWILLILLPLLNFKGSKAPRTNLEAFTINDLLVTRDNTSYHASGNFTVLFQARNPSSVVGFRHRYLSTLVTVLYHNTQLGQSEVPRFSQAYQSAGNVSTDVVFREQRLDEPVGLSLMDELQETQAGVGLRVKVDAYVKVKRLGWHGPSWFNLTCLVEATQSGALLTKVCR